MVEFSLLSLNTFGLPFYLGWDRLARLSRHLNQLPLTAICLQEIQQNAYAHLIQRGLTDYPHAAFERHHYAPKGGLAVFSRLPGIEQRFEVYADRGVWHSISIADWALYKGIQFLRFDVQGMPVAVLNTHLNANYGGVWQQDNHLTKILHRQVGQLSQAIRSIPEDTLVIICGDFNFPRKSFLYDELIEQAGLLDPLAQDPRHTYRPFPLVPSKWKTSLDYALVRRPAGMDFHVQADLMAVEDTTKILPFQRFLSDHNALMLNIRWESAGFTGAG
jgi:hypothetical protein